MSPIRALLFDKDGTLIDFEASWGPAVATVLQELADGDPGLLARLAAASGFDPRTRLIAAGSLLIAEPTSVFGAVWADLLGVAATPDFLAGLDARLCKATTANLAPIGDPLRILRDLAARGYRVGVFTNDAEASARAHLAKLGLTELLCFIAGYDSGFGAKPDPGPVAAFARAAGVTPAEVAVIGDTPTDLAAARAAGAVAIGVLSGPMADDLRREPAAALLGSLADLAPWLDSKRHEPGPV